MRHDYSEMYRIDGGDQFGRNDVAKLGHVTLEIFETGHVAHYHRTYGRTLAEGDVSPPPVYNSTHVKTSADHKITVDMRHAWAEELDVAPSGAVDEFRRKRARNDYPVMALWEMGLRRMRVPIQDLLEAKSRRRMELLQDVGHKFQVYVYDVPKADVQDAICQHAGLIDRLEIVISWDRRGTALPAIKELKARCGCTILLSRVNRKDAAKTSGGKYNHLISHGFSVEELDELVRFSASTAALPVDGFVFSILRDIDPVSTMTSLEVFARETGKKPVLYIKSTSASPWAAFVDDQSNALRMGEAALAVAASASVEIILDSFCDSDRAVTLCELDWLIGDTIRGLPASS